MIKSAKTNQLWFYIIASTPKRDSHRYFYDSFCDDYFYAQEVDNEVIKLYTHMGFPVTERQSADIYARLSLLDEGLSGLLEIKHLNVQEKMRIQHDFLNHFKDEPDINALTSLVMRQSSASGMMLDQLLPDSIGHLTMVKYWNDYKLTCVEQSVHSKERRQFDGL